MFSIIMLCCIYLGAGVVHMFMPLETMPAGNVCFYVLVMAFGVVVVTMCCINNVIDNNRKYMDTYIEYISSDERVSLAQEALDAYKEATRQLLVEKVPDHEITVVEKFQKVQSLIANIDVSKTGETFKHYYKGLNELIEDIAWAKRRKLRLRRDLMLDSARFIGGTFLINKKYLVTLDAEKETQA